MRDGEALAALVIPADAADRLQAMLSLAGGEPPTVEVFYNAEDPVKRRYVESTIRSRLAEADAALSDAVLAQSAKYIDLVVKGGKLSFPLVGEVEILGLRNARTLIDTSLRGLPEDAPERPALQQVSRFARLAADNLDLSRPILSAIGQPVRVKQTVVEGSKTPLDQFAVSVAATLSLMLVTVLLAAALLALEREEGVYARLRRLVSANTLLLEKIVLAAAAALVVTLLQLAVIRVFVCAQLPAARAGRRRAGVRRARDRARRAGARGPGRDAAGGPARAAARLPRADPLRRGERDALRRAQHRLRRLPVQADAARARR